MLRIYSASKPIIALRRRLQSPIRRTELVPWLVATGVGLALGAAVPLLPQLLAIALLPAAVVIWWITLRPEMGLLLIVAITGGLVNYDQLPYLSLGPISLHITDLLLLYLLALAAVRLLLHHDSGIVRTRLDVPLLVFYGLALLATLAGILQQGVAPNVALREFRIVTYWLAFLAVTQLIREQRQLNTLIQGLLVLAALMTAVVLLQMAVPSLPLVRVSSETLVTAGTSFAGVSRVWITGERLIYTLLIVAACMALFAQTGRARLLYLGAAAFFALWLFFSFQRNYWLTALLALGMLGFLVNWPERWRALRWLLLVAAILALAFAVPASPLAAWGTAAFDRLLSLQGTRLQYDTSAVLREVELQYALIQVKAHPLLGVGVGNNYRPWMRRFDYFPSSPESPGLIWYCHNAYMWIWVKMGTLALAAFLWLCLRFLYRGLRRWRQLTDWQERAVVLGFTLAFVGHMVSNMVAPNFIQNWVLVVYPIMMGINELIYRRHSTELGWDEHWRSISADAVRPQNGSSDVETREIETC